MIPIGEELKLLKAYSKQSWEHVKLVMEDIVNERPIGNNLENISQGLPPEAWVEKEKCFYIKTSAIKKGVGRAELHWKIYPDEA